MQKNAGVTKSNSFVVSYVVYALYIVWWTIYQLKLHVIFWRRNLQYSLVEAEDLAALILESVITHFKEGTPT